MNFAFVLLLQNAKKGRVMEEERDCVSREEQ